MDSDLERRDGTRRKKRRAETEMRNAARKEDLAHRAQARDQDIAWREANRREDLRLREKQRITNARSAALAAAAECSGHGTPPEDILTLAERFAVWIDASSHEVDRVEPPGHLLLAARAP
jgi:UDP-N-acetylmuramoylalanine-D-glutamate ligase